MKNSLKLPQWLDDYIYKELGAKYCCSNTDMTVIDWDKSDILNYLGTYFPRSYTESYCIFKAYLENNLCIFSKKKEISIFDFGCGTGGEIIGLLTILINLFPNLKKINIAALDGNQYALRLYEKVIEQFSQQTSIDINSKPAPLKIEDFYDLTILDEVLDKKFDIIISFKAICEFVTKECFEKNNPYEYIAKTFPKRLKDNGLILLVDVTSFNNVSKEWLPEMMDKGLSKINCNKLLKNEGYNQAFYVSHSKKQKDLSKVAWRIIRK